MYGRRMLVHSAHLNEVIHVIAIEARIGGDVRAIAFTDLQFIDLQEVFARTIEFTLLHKLVVVELREEHGLVGVVQREAEAALRGDITEFLIEGLVPVKLVHVLIHVYLRVTTFPCAEVLQPRPEILRIEVSGLSQYLTQFLGSFGVRRDILIQLGADIERDIEIGTNRTFLYIVYHLFFFFYF